MNLRNKKKNGFWRQLRFKYKLSFLNESTLEEVFSFRLSRLGALASVAGMIVLIVGLVVFLVAGTPVRTFLPGYLDMELRSVLVTNNMRLDSIVRENERRNQYLEQVRLVLTGETPVDSVIPLDSIVTAPVDSLLGKSERERAFVARFEQEEKYNLTILSRKEGPQTPSFYPPVRGVVTEHHAPDQGRYGVLITCADQAPVSTPLEGTVIYTGYTLEEGYVVHVQHPGGYVSVYKGLAGVSKPVSRVLSEGTVIGNMPGNRSKKTENYLCYQLWYEGTPLDPEEYINF